MGLVKAWRMHILHRTVVFRKIESKERVVGGSRALVGAARDKCWGWRERERERERERKGERERDQTSSVCTREDGTVGGDNGGERKESDSHMSERAKEREVEREGGRGLTGEWESERAPREERGALTWTKKQRGRRMGYVWRLKRGDLRRGA